MPAPAAFCCEPARAAAGCKKYACSAHLSVYLDILLRNWSASELTISTGCNGAVWWMSGIRRMLGLELELGCQEWFHVGAVWQAVAPAEEAKFGSEGYTGLIQSR